MHAHPRVHHVSRANDRSSPKSTSTCDLPPIQFVIHADPEMLCKCCGTHGEQNKIQGLESFCRNCCDKNQDRPVGEPVAAQRNQENEKSSYRSNEKQARFIKFEDSSMQTDECQTHFHKHLYNASLLEKYCGGNIFGPLPLETMDEEEARSDSADEIVIEETTDATQTDESEFPKVKLVRVLSDAETQTHESILSQLASPASMSGSTTSSHMMKQVNTSLTMIRSQNPFLYNFNESSYNMDGLLQPCCQCLSSPSASPSFTSGTQTQQSLSTIYKLSPEEKKTKSDNQKFMGCFKRKKDKKKNA